MEQAVPPSYGRGQRGRSFLTKAERVLSVGGMGLIASAIVLVAYATHSNAGPQPSGCGADAERLTQALDQLRFATSADRALSSALAYSTHMRVTYVDEIEAVRQERGSASNSRIRGDLDRASAILRGQASNISHAEAIANEAQRELRSGAPLVSQASADLNQEDCRALSLTMAESGWPKDHLLDELAFAARLNSSANDQLDSALALIAQARESAQQQSIGY